MPLVRLDLRERRVTDLSPLKSTVGLTVIDWRGKTVLP
jgi:hypothetical protein